tara:strand:- start:288 stop:473 length:186 start_codon:yes stop_codon:yes gene_type:complete
VVDTDVATVVEVLKVQVQILNKLVLKLILEAQEVPAEEQEVQTQVRLLTEVVMVTKEIQVD